MEVIVDDSQLSLAIGKRGQNVRLAAKLLGWKIDIKSEEEKRQEVQNAINLLSTGVPVSALIDFGLAEATVDALVKGDIGTVEKLGGMTPEQLESIPDIDADAVSRIQQAINGYYGQDYTEQNQQEAGTETAAELAEESAETAPPSDAVLIEETVSVEIAADSAFDNMDESASVNESGSEPGVVEIQKP
jgi:transcription termination/antitermination protein NusA